jgi:hypothetical protein
MDYDAIIIGSGFGGSAYKTTICRITKIKD